MPIQAQVLIKPMRPDIGDKMLSKERKEVEHFQSFRTFINSSLLKSFKIL
jgi:hypothetical protein